MAKFTNFGLTSNGYRMIAQAIRDGTPLVISDARCNEVFMSDTDITNATTSSFISTSSMIGVVKSVRTTPTWLYVDVEFTNESTTQTYNLKSFCIRAKQQGGNTNYIFCVCSDQKSITLPKLSEIDGLVVKLQIGFYLRFDGASTYITQS